MYYKCLETSKLVFVAWLTIFLLALRQEVHVNAYCNTRIEKFLFLHCIAKNHFICTSGRNVMQAKIL